MEQYWPQFKQEATFNKTKCRYDIGYDFLTVATVYRRYDLMRLGSTESQTFIYIGQPRNEGKTQTYSHKDIYLDL